MIDRAIIQVKLMKRSQIKVIQTQKQVEIHFLLNGNIKSVVHAKPGAIKIHCWQKDRTNNIYTLKNVKKTVKEITYISKDYVTKIIISGIAGRHDLGVKENEEALTIN